MLQSIHSAQQLRDAGSLPKSLNGPENAPQRHACAFCIIDAWGVTKPRPPGRRGYEIGCIHDGEIDAGEPGGGEPPRRVSGRWGRHERGRRCEAPCPACRRARRQSCRGKCGGRCAGIGAAVDAPMRSMVRWSRASGVRTQNGPRRRRSDDAARRGGVVRPRCAGPGCRGCAPCRRGSR